MKLDWSRRECVASAISRTASAKGWTLLACNVRTNHVHVVVAAVHGVAPESMLTTLKAWSTRTLRESKLVDPEWRVWSRHGSTRYLKNDLAVEHACQYVLEMQDERRD